MAVKNRADLSTLLTDNITDALNRQNTAARVREVIQDVIDSCLNSIDDVFRKEYIALLTQSGLTDPTVTIIRNTLGVTPTVTRDDVGNYFITAVGEFTEDKTICEIDHYLSDTFGKATIQRGSADICEVSSYNSSEVQADDLLLNNWVKITVYP